MLRGVAAVAGGLIVWIIVITAGNLAVRAVIPGYGDAEAALRAAEVGYTAGQASMPFTLSMMVARLLLGGIASIVAGATCIWIARAATRASWALGILLVVLFIPVHAWLWQRFPVWYHLTFLLSLLPCALLGAALAARRRG
jgi:hypothetical protein